jgi:hypothetical protein
MKWFLEWLCLQSGERIIRVKSWRPSWGRYGIEWPCLLIDRLDGSRSTAWPVWDWIRIKGLLGFRHEDRFEPAADTTSDPYGPTGNGVKLR